MSISRIGEIKLSVIIAAWNGADMLHACLSSLKHQINLANSEIIVVSNFRAGIDQVSMDFPPVIFHILNSGTTVPQLRTHGILKSKGTIVALSEDLGIFDLHWSREILRGHERGYSIIGGAVENSDNQNLLSWTVYFYDYGKYMSLTPERVVQTLSGINVSYTRDILCDIENIYASGFFETFVHENLKDLGYNLYLMPSAIFFHRKSYQFQPLIQLFYNQSRSYAARRVLNFSITKKILFALASLFLPVLLPLRILWQTVFTGRHLKKFVLSLPILISLMSIWSFGEFFGYLFGEGESGDKWK